MLQTNPNFDAYHGLNYKTPMYLVKFDGVSTHFCNHKPGSPTGTLKQYLKSIGGGSQTIQPELGKSSIASHAIDIVDVNNEVSALISADTYNWHRKDVTILAGYKGMDESNMLSIGVGAVTGIKIKSGGTYSFSVTDVKKWLQKEIFTTATDAAPVTVQGNVINVLLQILTSTGNGTNGDYDIYDAANGAGIDDAYINISQFEEIRDAFYPGNSHYVKITATEPIKAKEFIEIELLKAVTNAFLSIDGNGHLTMITYRPSLASSDQTLTLNEDNIIGIPRWSAGFEQMINHVEFFYNYDHVDDEYDTHEIYIDSDSMDNRGPGSKTLKIKSRGLHTDISPASLNVFTSDVIARHWESIKKRYSKTPPTTLKVSCFFGAYLAEAGDIAEVTHSQIPDLNSGVRGITGRRMQIVNRVVNWSRGLVTFSLLDTQFGNELYRGLSPFATVVSGSSQTSFTVSTTDASKYANFNSPVVKILDSGMRNRVSNIIITDVNTATGVVTTSSMGLTPAAGDLVVFDDYDNVTDDQKKYCYTADSTDDLGTSNDDAHLVAP